MRFVFIMELLSDFQDSLFLHKWTWTRTVLHWVSDRTFMKHTDSVSHSGYASIS